MRNASGDNGQTVAGVLRQAAVRLSDISDTPELDANLLLAQVLGKPRSFMVAHPDHALGQSDVAAFHALVVRRAGGQPAAYLLGSKGFWTLELTVSPAVLVPRPETETLVEAALERLPPAKPVTIADLGTGSGAIALALATERPLAQVVATDRADAALAVAKTNARQCGLIAVEFAQGDWFAPLTGRCFDLVVSNPPYVAENDPYLAALKHEPRNALVAPDNGLRWLRHLAAGAPGHLLPGGWLLLEHGATQGEPVRAALHAAGFVDIQTRADLAGLPRVTMGRKPDYT